MIATLLAIVWAVAVGVVLVLVHGGTRDRSNGPRPGVGEDVSDSGEWGEPPSHSSSDDGS